MRRALVLLPAAAWLALLVAAPLLILLGIAFAEAGPGVPPFIPPLGWDGGPVWRGSAANFATLAEDGYYLAAFAAALWVAGLTAGLCLLLAFPMALGIAAARPGWRLPLLLAVLLPFWAGFLPRLGAWIGILRDGGWLNGLLLRLGLVEAPLPLLFSEPAMLAGMVHAYLPFAVLPLAVALMRRDPAIEDAAADLGAGGFTIFRTITLPLAAPAAAAGFLLVFIPAAGEFVIPALLGPPEANLIGRVLWVEFFQNRDWPLAAALAVVLLALLVPPILLFQRVEAGR